MNKQLQVGLMITASMLAFCTPAFAGEPGDLEDRIAQLEAMVKELKGELADQKVSTDTELVRLKKRQVAPSQVDSDSTQPTISWGGIIDIDAHVSDFSDGEVAGSSIVRDFYIPSATPIGGIGEDPSTDFTAQASRIFVTANKEIDGHKIGGRFEMDFLGSSQGNEAVSNSYSPRLRRAFVTFDNWLLGQEWSTFQNTSAIPESASFLALSDGMIFVRQPQIRYTKGSFQFAIENPNTNTNIAGLADDNALPDIVGRYNFKGDFGNISFAGIGRQLKAELGAVSEEVMGYGMSVSGRIKAGEKDDLRFTVSGGEGIGRYIGLGIGKSADLNLNGVFEAIPSVGGFLAYRHVLTNGHRLNIGASGISIDNLDSATAAATKQSLSGYLAYMWEIAPKVTLGAEFMHAVRENEGGEEGKMNRFTFSTKYAF